MEKILLDIGSHRVRAGFESQDLPSLTIPTQVKSPIDEPFSVLKESKRGLKTPYESNLVYNFDNMEILLDSIFNSLGITSKVSSPILLTEPVCTPNYCRKNMNELLFECYEIPSVCYGIDALFSWYHYSNSVDLDNKHRNNALIISSSHYSTHILPIVNNKFLSSYCKRISIGGYHCTDYIYKLISCKYPPYLNLLSFDKVQHIKETQCYVASDYANELNNFKLNSDELVQNTVFSKIQVEKSENHNPTTHVSATTTNTSHASQPKEIAPQQHDKTNKENIHKLAKYEELYTYKYINMRQFQKKLKEEGIFTEENLVRLIKQLSSKEGENNVEGHNNESVTIDLTNVPDDQLNEDQKKEKKRQLNVINTKQGKIKKALERERLQVEMELKYKENPQEFIKILRARRSEIIAQRDKRKREKANASRYPGSKKLKMKANVAAEESVNNLLGQNDSDWDIKDNQNKIRSEDTEEDLTSELQRIETLLKKYDIVAFAGNPLSSISADELDYNIYLSSERIRVPEILFQPSLIGSDQMGIIECVYHVLNQFSGDVQRDLCQNIYVTGGSASFSNIENRIKIELQQLRPIGTPINVLKAKDPSLDAWKGMRDWTRSPLFQKSLLSKKMYEEYGHDYLMEAEIPLSNNFLSIKS